MLPHDQLHEARVLIEEQHAEQVWIEIDDATCREIYRLRLKLDLNDASSRGLSR